MEASLLPAPLNVSFDIAKKKTSGAPEKREEQHMKRITKITLFALGLVAMPTIALPVTFTTIDPPGSTFTFPFGINPQGDVVGNYSDEGGVVHGFLRHGGNFTTIDFPGSTDTFARRISPQGDV